MSLPPNATKPLVLVYPCAYTSNFQRCLVIAQHLRPFFDFRFLHTDQQAHLVYQLGFETFMGNFFPFLLSITGEKAPESFDEQLELAFLEQVEILETLQPDIIIGDGVYTLSMAAEFTGIPFVSVISGYQSPYFANSTGFNGHLSNHEPYRLIREKYGLNEKNTLQEELEGKLNWICDLPELYPQKELPFHYELIGPLIDIPKPAKETRFDKLSSFKKAVIIDLDDAKPVNWLNVLNATTSHGYSVIVRITDQNRMLLQNKRVSSYTYSTDQFSNADLLMCNSEGLVYTALFYGLPVIFKPQFAYQERIIEALEQWHVGTSWEKVVSTGELEIDYWVHNKHSDIHRTLQYKLKDALNSLSLKLYKSISLHFPYLEKSAISILK